jgi:hypothetical protein
MAAIIMIILKDSVISRPKAVRNSQKKSVRKFQSIDFESVIATFLKQPQMNNKQNDRYPVLSVFIVLFILHCTEWDLLTIFRLR